jgi:hypothetical protein
MTGRNRPQSGDSSNPAAARGIHRGQGESPITYGNCIKQLVKTGLSVSLSDRLLYANSRTALISKTIKVQRLTEMRDSLREAIEVLNALD